MFLYTVTCVIPFSKPIPELCASTIISLNIYTIFFFFSFFLSHWLCACLSYSEIIAFMGCTTVHVKNEPRLVLFLSGITRGVGNVFCFD